MLEKVIEVDSIEIVNKAIVQVRTKTSIVENGNLLSSSYHRHVIQPGEDYSKEDDLVQKVCALVHTPQAVLEAKTLRVA